MAKGIRALLDTVMQALPQVGNLGLLFFLLFFIFAALGVELFGRLGKKMWFRIQKNYFVHIMQLLFMWRGKTVVVVCLFFSRMWWGVSLPGTWWTCTLQKFWNGLSHFIPCSNRWQLEWYHEGTLLSYCSDDADCKLICRNSFSTSIYEA